ncbi:MAG: hypothetical protein EXS63_04410 [Candidatus Omnitrophica bacterium]|nr:hypothetical protein [Candidatus Omnitrophota bacterium]
MTLLSTRQQSILNRVVDTYVETGQPVGSRHITKLYTEMYQSSYSSATVRYEMLRLEDKGYLTHPHTSAGRIPTDSGYRYYVDHGMKLERPKEDTFQQLHEDVQDTTRLETFADRVSLMLSKLSGQLGLMLLPEHRRNPARDYRISIRGANRISEQPEFHDRSKLSLLLESLENRKELALWLGERKQNAGTTISIGKENEAEAFQVCSVISAQVFYEGEALGVLALVGPKRMCYGRAVPLVSEMAQIVSRLLEIKRVENFSSE